MAYDEFGNWIDDQSTFGYEDPSLYNNPYMQAQMPGQNFSTAKWNFGAPQAVGQNVYNQFLTGQKNLAALQTSPQFAYNAMVATGQPTMNLNALMGLDDSGNPYLGGGGAGGGGGGGGNAYNPNFMTNNLDALKNSPAGTPGNLIYTGIRTNQSPVDIKLSLRKDGAYDTDTLKVLDQQVDDAFNEFSAAQRNQLAGANQPAQRTPIQEWLDKNGLINPAQQYTAESLPADVNVDWAGMQGGKAQQDAFNEATMTGRKIGNINDERQALQNKAKVSNLVRTAQLSLLQGQADDRTNAPYVNPSTGAPVNFAGNMSAQANAITPRPRVDTGAVGGWLGAVTRPVKDAAAQVLNPGGDVARMAMLKAAARAQERRKTNLVRSVQSAPAYDQAVRQLAAQQVQQSGRTPARDAQRVLLNYMRQGGAAI